MYTPFRSINKKIILLLYLIGSIHIGLFGQGPLDNPKGNPCEEILIDLARQNYVDGKPTQELLAEIQPCINRILKTGSDTSKFRFKFLRFLGRYPRENDSIPKSVKSKALKLRVELYLERDFKGTNNNRLAEESFKELLKRIPNFRPQKNDSLILINLFRKYKPQLNLTVNLHGGLNLPFVSIIHNYGIENTDTEGEEISSRLDLATGIGLDKILGHHWRVGFEINYVQRTFDVQNDLATFIDRSGFAQLRYTENQKWIDLNLLAKYQLYLGTSPWSILFQGGLGANYLFDADLNNISRINTNIASENETSGDITALREAWNYSPIAGIRLQTEIGLNNLYLDFRYQGLLRNMANPQTRYDPFIMINETDGLDNADLIGDYGYVSDDFYHHNLIASIGYSINVYRPNPETRKVRKKRTKKERDDSQ